MYRITVCVIHVHICSCCRHVYKYIYIYIQSVSLNHKKVSYIIIIVYPIEIIWLVVSTPLKNMSQWEGLSWIIPYIMENKSHDWNHQPDMYNVHDVSIYMPIEKGYQTSMIAVGYISLTSFDPHSLTVLFFSGRLIYFQLSMGSWANIWLLICNIAASDLKSKVFLAACWERNLQ